jgi:hypothetical protein
MSRDRYCPAPERGIGRDIRRGLRFASLTEPSGTQEADLVAPVVIADIGDLEVITRIEVIGHLAIP